MRTSGSEVTNSKEERNIIFKKWSEVSNITQERLISGRKLRVKNRLNQIKIRKFNPLLITLKKLRRDRKYERIIANEHKVKVFFE